MHVRFVKFIDSINNSDNSVLKLCISHAYNGSASVAGRNISLIVHKYHLPRQKVGTIVLPLHTFTDDVTVSDDDLITCGIIRDLLYINSDSKLNAPFPLSRDECLFCIKLLCSE